ncbi:MAG: hypothetical protein FWD46_07500 [Cystobacterineae bacterium]|nr:hypothetical protein [Cystobacterineae bacterium]
MLPLKKNARCHKAQHACPVGKRFFITLLLLLTPACISAKIEDACYLMDGLPLEKKAPADNFEELSVLEEMAVNAPYSAELKIPVQADFARAIESARKENLHPKLYLKSVRLVSPNNTAHLFEKIEMTLSPPPGSSLPEALAVEHHAPTPPGPMDQVYLQTHPVNVVDYLAKGALTTKLDITTQINDETLWVNVEVCMDGSLSWP